MEATTSHEPKAIADHIVLWVDVAYKITVVVEAIVSFVRWLPFLG